MATTKSTTNTNRPPSKKRRRKPIKKSGGQQKKKPARRALHVRENPSDENAHEKICIQADPMPEGFVFVPKGDPYVTRNCKSRSKAAASTVYIVYDNKQRSPLGIRVSKPIYDIVTTTALQTASDRATAVRQRDVRDQHKAKRVLQATFPRIPARCLDGILKHAFLKGSGRVGRTATRPDKVKATLAVEAHIRHKHTAYERLLEDGVERERAREDVWGLVKEMRDEWAGEKEEEEEVSDLEWIETKKIAGRKKMGDT